MEGIEVGQRRLPRPVDGTVTFVGHHNVEVSAGELRIPTDHGLQQAYRDLLFLARHAGLQPVTPILRKEVLHRLQGLLGKLLPIHQEKNPFGAPRFNQSLQIQTGEVGLARPGGELDKKPPFPQFNGLIEGLHRLFLVGTNRPLLPLTKIVIRDRNGRHRPALLAHGHQPLQVAPGIEGVDDAGVVVGIVPEVDQFAIGQKDKRRSEPFGVRKRLLFGGIGMEGRTFGLDDRKGPSILRKKDIVGASCRDIVTVSGHGSASEVFIFCQGRCSSQGSHRDFRQNHRLVSRVPVRLPELSINHNPGVRFS